MLFLAGLGEEGVAIPSRASAAPIRVATPVPSFQVLGGQQVEDPTISPPIMRQRGHIYTRREVEMPNPVAAYLDRARAPVAAIMQALRRVPAQHRQQVLTAAFRRYRPDGGARIDGRTAQLIARGVPAYDALHEAIARELAGTVLEIGSRPPKPLRGRGVSGCCSGGLGSLIDDAGEFAEDVYEGGREVVDTVAGGIEYLSCGGGEVVAGAAGAIVGTVGGGEPTGGYRQGQQVAQRACGTARDVRQRTSEQREAAPPEWRGVGPRDGRRPSVGQAQQGPDRGEVIRYMRTLAADRRAHPAVAASMDGRPAYAECDRLIDRGTRARFPAWRGRLPLVPDIVKTCWASQPVPLEINDLEAVQARGGRRITQAEWERDPIGVRRATAAAVDAWRRGQQNARGSRAGSAAVRMFRRAAPDGTNWLLWGALGTGALLWLRRGRRAA